MGKKLPVILNIEEFNKILKHTSKPHHKLAFKLGFLCGLRISEIVKLKKNDIDRSRGMLYIRQAKGKKDRYVPIPAPLRKDLKHIPIKCKKRSLQAAFDDKVFKAKITKNVTFHTLRHSCASYYLSQGMDIKQVQQLLGHSRITTTEIYLHTNPEAIQKRMEEIWK